jgi:hypothetical protein
MRPTLRTAVRTATAAGVLGLTVLSAAPAAHAGCVKDQLTASYPGGDPTVTINPDGSITIDPNPTLNLVNAVKGNASVFVKCVV